jgi:AraC family transcriptional regulator, regulatory protein of adaptative response / methylated-DNA-[protein]-cysteine methyltransferase
MTSAEDITYTLAPSRLGLVLVATSEKGVCAILIDDDAEVLRKDLKSRFRNTTVTEDSRSLEGVAAAVVRFIETPTSRLEVALDIRGSSFQKRVWDILRAIPAGLTASYAEIAERLNAPAAVRAVAGACAANALAVAIPCHRVVRSDGRLSGYRWGVARKEALLKAEGAR